MSERKVRDTQADRQISQKLRVHAGEMLPRPIRPGLWIILVLSWNQSTFHENIGENDFPVPVTLTFDLWLSYLLSFSPPDSCLNQI